ncbi:NAD(P)/FAD-dependent oxidoreductase [Rhodoligotrophos defluvii]|uniref:NAD(P)/FAD-dependent oxidoreductase n=1 Tax=Rhodoligotrophos defluvii TaxID=2561934 RepID=UPI001485A677|nr:NAD(P)/FAD-dependent oxidoreductase [Rhodoligotrophos defluvii]
MSTRVVIIGAGFGGLACAGKLAGSRAEVILIDRLNHHLFQPLLYQVATAALSPADIAEPVRKIFRRHGNIRVMMDEVTGIDLGRKEVWLSIAAPVPYDVLVVSTGSGYGYFDHDEWARHAPGLKTLEDARTIRARLLKCFELADLTDDPAYREALMTSVIIGGGPTGVEMAGSIAELCRWTLAGEFSRIDPRQARVLLVEAGPRILSGFPEHLSAYAEKALANLGVTVRTDTRVTDVRADGVSLGDEFVPSGSIVWAAGVIASPAASWLELHTNRSGQIPVAEDLSVPGLRDVYVIGDTALFMQDGQPLPGLAQVAKQQGQHLGKGLRRRIEQGVALPPFRFRNRGNTAVIGRHAAVFDFGRWQMKGRLAWLLWAMVHVYLLVGFEKRLLVSLQWLWRYFTGARGARLISAPLTREQAHEMSDVAAPRKSGAMGRR